MTQLPIKLAEIVQLQQLGIAQASIGFASLTIESEKNVCICEKLKDSAQVVIVECNNPPNVIRYPVKADSARMNPLHNLIALKSGKNIQVYDAVQKKKIKSYVLPEDVSFWKWISPTMIALVTESAIYHWTTNDETDSPAKIFDTHESLKGHQIISYMMDNSQQWMALVGISLQETRIVGNIQLYSAARRMSQVVEGHACTFVDITMEGNSSPSNVFAFASRGAQASRMNVIELGAPTAGNQPFPKRSIEIFFPPEATADFPLAMHKDKTSGIVYMITKMGYIHMFEPESGSCLFVNRISNDVVFTSADLVSGIGFVCVNRNGSVYSVQVNREQIVQYLSSRKLDDVSFKLAVRAGYPGAEGAFLAKFNDLLSKQMYAEAARIAAKSSGNSIRNQQTVNRLRSIPATPGQQPPILLYFGILLENGKINAEETLELCRPVIQQGKRNLLEKWLVEDKLECTEELGDLTKPMDINLALSVYLRGKCHHKVIQCFAETGQFQKIILYANKAGFKPEYSRILRPILMSNPDAGLQYAKTIVQEGTEGIDINALANTFIELNLVPQCTAFLLEALKKNLPEHADLQTKLLEMNIMSAPQVAEAIFANNVLTHFDKGHIAKLCEQGGMTQRALQFYTDIYDIKRAIVQSNLIHPDFLVSYFGSLSVDDSLSCLRAMLEYNLRQNLQAVVQVAIKYYEQLTPNALIKLFESFKSAEGLFLFLSAVVNYNQDPDVHFKYIQAAVKTGQFKEVERICKESNSYDPEKVKNFLKEAKLTDQIPLIIVCDRFNFVQDLVLHLHKNNLLRYIEIYVQKVNPNRLPEIVGSLLDVGSQDDFVRNMISSCPLVYSLDRLVEEVSIRNRIKLVMPLLESKIASGSVETAVHSALAIVYIDTNNRPEQYLRENAYYDGIVVGRYCEKRDPQLACVAYERGGHDDELIRVCTVNSLYKNLARYLIFKKDGALWAKVLTPSNENRRSLIDQVIQSVLSDNYDPDCISEMVKAFMAAELPNDLIDVLEKIVLTESPYKGIRNLQNLLLLTAIKANPSKIIEYVNRLDNYDAPNIASVAVNNKLYEEAFVIYKKYEVHASAVHILVEYIKNIDRAYEYVERCNKPETWSILAKAQLASGFLKEAIDSFCKADDSSAYMDVINASRSSKAYESLLKYIQMVRVTIKDSHVDNEFAFCLAVTGRNDKLEEILNQSHNINVIPTADRIFDMAHYEAAKIMYRYATNYPKLAITMVKLKEYQNAVEIARKANNIKTWREVCFACVLAEEYRSAQICAVNLVVNPEELEELIKFYEEKGLFEQLIVLIEASVGLERAHMGMFTELAILYCKYKPKKLKEHLDLFWTRINIPKVLRNVETYHMWPEMVFLYEKYEEFDNAVLTMIKHPAEAFQDTQFRDVISKVANTEIHYKSITFYSEYKPLMINELVMAISGRVDHSRCINHLKSLKVLSLCKTYLLHIQKNNISAINEALNLMLVEEEAYDELRNSIGAYNNYDALKLAQSLENHASVEFRRISNTIYKSCNRWQQSIEMAKKDGLNMDAVIYAYESKDPTMAQTLLDHFLESGRPDCVVALLYFCYEIMKPDEVLESCWLFGKTDYCMPFLIQTLKDSKNKIDTIEVKQTKHEEQAGAPGSGDHISSFGGPQLMLGGPGGFAPAVGSFSQVSMFGSGSGRPSGFGPSSSNIY